MPSVKYNETTLIAEVETHEYEDPDTGETVTTETEHPQHPFEVRISKWLKRGEGYHLFGFVDVTEFGQTLASKSDPWAWVNGTYTISDGLSETMVAEMVNGVSAVKNAELDAILDFGNVSPVSAEIESKESDRFDFHIVLDGAETFDIDWLTADFDPSRGDA